MTTSSVQPGSGIPPGLDFFVAGLYAKSRGEQFGLSGEQFAAILREVGGKYLPAGSGESEWKEFLGGLRLEDLALARACAAGNDHAWEVFLTRFREKLYDIAGHIAKDAATARELADSMYAELYGLQARGADSQAAQRVSKLASYSGRGSLDGWLRMVMMQEYINGYRRQKRLVSLEEKEEQGEGFAAPDPAAAQPVDPQVEAATDAALAELSSEERFLLAAYYLDGRTLAEIARLLGKHESTVSRKLDRVANSLRKQIIATLTNGGMSRRQAQEAMEIDVRDLQINLRNFAQKSDGEAFPEKKIQPSGDGAR